MIPPDAFPLQHEPGSEALGPRPCDLGLERLRGAPAPGEDLVLVDADRVRAAPDEDRAEFVLGSGGIELRLVLELEQKMQRTAQAQLLIQPTVDRALQGLGAPGMTAAAIGPVQRPKPFGRRPLLQQALAGAAEDEQGESPMQDAGPLVAQR